MDRQRECTYCFRVRNNVCETKYGGFICNSCRVRLYRKDEKNWQICSHCSRLRPVAGLDGTLPLCGTCYFRKRATCVICSKEGTYKRSRCYKCYVTKAVKVTACNACGKEYSYTLRTNGICEGCVKKASVKRAKREYCYYCLGNKPVARRLPNGQACCNNCRKKYLTMKDICQRCSRIDYIFLHRGTNIKVCPACYANLQSTSQNRVCKKCRKNKLPNVGIEIHCSECLIVPVN